MATGQDVQRQFDISVIGKGVARGASLEQCWGLIEDPIAYQDWVSFFSKGEEISPGKDEQHGVGSVRKLYDQSGRGILEVVNIYYRPYVFGYRIIDREAGLKDHQGVVALREVPEGTEIAWCMTANNIDMFSEKSGDVFQTSRAEVQAAMQNVIDITVRDLTAACEAKSRS